MAFQQVMGPIAGELTPFLSLDHFASWDFRFRVFANRYKCAALLVPQLDSSEREEDLEKSNPDINQLLLELLVLSCSGDAGDILQYEMVQPTGRAAWLRIQSRYAGSTSVKIASLYIDLFRQVIIADADSSIIAINKWFFGWKSLASLVHEHKSEAICAVAELSLPVSIFSITFSHLKLSGSALPVPQLMDRLRSVAVEATIRVGRDMI